MCSLLDWLGLLLCDSVWADSQRTSLRPARRATRLAGCQSREIPTVFVVVVVRRDPSLSGSLRPDSRFQIPHLAASRQQSEAESLDEPS